MHWRTLPRPDQRLVRGAANIAMDKKWRHSSESVQMGLEEMALMVDIYGQEQWRIDGRFKESPQVLLIC
jgi:hypothetical protein